MPRGERYHDPMRELDLLLLEELMMRRDLQPTRTATVLQTLSMLLVLLWLTGWLQNRRCTD
jgi:hypothetical protein